MKKKIGLIILLLVVVGLIFFIKGQWFKENSTIVMSTNQNTLVKNFEENYREKVVKVFIDDFDVNGTKEAFLITGKLENDDAENKAVWSEGKVWFANELRTEMVQDGFSTETTFNPEVMTLGEIKVLHAYQESTTGKHSFLYGVVNDKPYTYFDCPLGGVGLDNGALYVSHDTSRYYLYCEKVNKPCKIKIREYGAIKIPLEQFLQFAGAQELYNSLNHSANHAEIGDILYRDNKTISINYAIHNENGYGQSYMDLIYDDSTVIFDGVGSGNYQTALLPEIASYPVFQSPEGKSAVAQPQVLYEYERSNGERFLSSTLKDSEEVTLVDTHAIDSYCLVNDRFYFSDDHEVVKYLDSNGKINRLEFTQSDYNLYFDWKISADGKKIAWIEDLSDDKDDFHGTFAVSIADLDGGNRKKAVRKLGCEEVLLIDQWVNQDLYYGKHICAVDGPEYLSDLYKLNAVTGKNEFIFGETQEEHEKRFSDGHSGEFISAVSADGNLIAYFKEGNLCIKDIKAEKTITLALPEDGHGFWGARFSPDGKRVAFACFGNGNNEDAHEWPTESWFFVEDIETRVFTKCETIQEVEDGPPEYYSVYWTSNNTLLINGKTITLEQ